MENHHELNDAPVLLKKALKATKRQMNIVVADSQYSSRSLRDQLRTIVLGL